METPVNASYGRGDVPEDPSKKMKIFGMIFRKDDMWKVGAVIGGVLLINLFFIFFLMPTGISFLAAKNSTGLLGFMGLFAGYMAGFLVIVTIFFAIVVGILYALQQSLA